MSNETIEVPVLRSWEITHHLLSEPLVMDGMWSEKVMLMFAVRWLDANLPHPDGDTWLVDIGSFTITDLGPVEPEMEPEASFGCPACGEPSDYCQGHGETGDPDGHRVLTRHDEDIHDECHPDAQCEGE